MKKAKAAIGKAKAAVKSVVKSALQSAGAAVDERTSPLTMIWRDAEGVIQSAETKASALEGKMHADLDALVDGAKKKGAQMVILLFGDHSIARHWVKPV